jgi:hypothetical protein
MKMKTKLIMLVSLLLAITTLQSNAMLIGTVYSIPVLPGPAAETAWVQAITGQTNLEFMAKQEGNASAMPSGPFASYFFVAGVGTPVVYMSWNVSATDYLVDYVLLKDGAGPVPHTMLYKLHAVELSQQAMLVPGDFAQFECGRNISHVSFFGHQNVADGASTAGMLGMSVFGLFCGFTRKWL